MDVRTNNNELEDIIQNLEKEFKAECIDNGDLRRKSDEIIASLIANRKRKKMTQSQIAEACNVHRNSICRVESFVEAPSLKMILKYADCLGMRLVLTDK